MNEIDELVGGGFFKLLELNPVVLVNFRIPDLKLAYCWSASFN